MSVSLALQSVECCVTCVACMQQGLTCEHPAKVSPWRQPYGSSPYGFLSAYVYCLTSQEKYSRQLAADFLLSPSPSLPSPLHMYLSNISSLSSLPLLLNPCLSWFPDPCPHSLSSLTPCPLLLLIPLTIPPTSYVIVIFSPTYLPPLQLYLQPSSQPFAPRPPHPPSFPQSSLLHALTPWLPSPSLISNIILI